MENEDGISIIFYLQKIFPGITYEGFYRSLSNMTTTVQMDTVQLLFTHMAVISFLDEWKNLLERLNCKEESEVWENEENVLQLRHWVSLRGQTLCRTGS